MENMKSLPSGYIEVEERGKIVVRSKFWYKRKDNLKGRTGKWSKWGAVQNTFQEQVKDWWYCQSCGEEYPEELSPLVYEVDSELKIRVCPFCYADGCRQYHNNLREID